MAQLRGLVLKSASLLTPIRKVYREFIILQSIIHAAVI